MQAIVVSGHQPLMAFGLLIKWSIWYGLRFYVDLSMLSHITYASQLFRGDPTANE